MNKTQMMQRLASAADYLDNCGLHEEADELTTVLRRLAQSLNTNHQANGVQQGIQGFQNAGQGIQNMFSGLGQAVRNLNPVTQTYNWGQDRVNATGNAVSQWAMQWLRSQGINPTTATPQQMAAATQAEQTARNWSQSAPSAEGKAPAQYSSQHNTNLNTPYVSQAMQQYQRMYAELKQNPQFANNLQGAKQYVINHAKQNAQSPEFVNMLVQKLV